VTVAGPRRIRTGFLANRRVYLPTLAHAERARQPNSPCRPPGQAPYVCKWDATAC
jgi:hypothetical protein